jgi:phosphatidate cytidylyltransferase
MTTRIITGAVIAVVGFLVIREGGWLFFALVMALGLFAANEFYRLTKAYRPLALPGLAGVALLLYMSWAQSLRGVLGAVAVTLFLVALTGLLVGPKRGVSVRMAMTVFGALYIGLGFGALLLLRALPGPEVPDDAALAIMVVFGTWVGDTMAYFTGKYFGATPMAPVLSPKKTWEGFAGGALSTILVLVFASLYTGQSAGEALLLGAVIAVTGPLGDLFESLIKRDMQIKDSGRGLPGHGGLLDRFDGVLWASVAGYFLAAIVLNYGP